MATQKLYAGAKLRETRLKLGLTQKAFAERLGVSLPYANQMEHNHRPVSSAVILALVQEFDFDVSELALGDGERMLSDLRETLADPMFTDQVPLADLRLVAANGPAFARAFLTLHRAYLEANERLASLDAALGQQEVRAGALPWEEVRDFFHYCDNYIDAVDRAAENFSAERSIDEGIEEALAAHGVTLQTADRDGALREFDAQSGTLWLSPFASEATRRFQALHQIALLQYANLIEATLDLARFQTETARSIAKVGLANYFAGAALLPYTRFLEMARQTRHDLDKLAVQFGASLEQVAHRLSTLQRPGAKGLPFFFVRVDQAGTITKRHSATRLQFARYGGACPLWNVHRAFETPGHFLRQLAETPDGVRYLCLAREISSPVGGPAFRAPVRRFAIALGCEIG
ncbi:MAG: short-chain fatty acyl-CoA regulator family protein, partial [Pseudomonadota bacterium]